MIPKCDDLERCNAELYKLIDHIASGAKNHWTVYHNDFVDEIDWETVHLNNISKSFDDYQEALTYFNSIEKRGTVDISLATRIGTAVCVLHKENQ